MSLLVVGCGLGEVTSPYNPDMPDSDDDGIPDGLDPNPHDPNVNDKNTAGRAQKLAWMCEGAAPVPTRPLQRLTETELANTLRDLVRVSSSEATAKAVMATVQPLLGLYPSSPRTPEQPFSTISSDELNEEHLKAFLRIGEELGKALTSSPQRIAEIAPCSKSASTSCIDDFITRFGRRALRHELNEAEKDFYRTIYGGNSSSLEAAGLADVIAVMLNAPDFVYRLQYLNAPAVNGVETLGDYELAELLSYVFWQSMPDDELLTAAQKGELHADAGFTKQLDRLLADPRAGTMIERFALEWLELDAMEPLTKNAGTDAFKAFSEGVTITPTLHQEMIADATASLAYHTFKQPGSVADWLKSQFSFAKSQSLANIYGTPMWNGTSAPPTFPTGQRAGLLTRAALLATRKATINTSPILKGVRLRRRLLCDDLPSPPEDFGALSPQDSQVQSTREVVERLTQQTGSLCSSCHEKRINPLGFVTEGYDALGRIRTKQPLYDLDTGELLSMADVKTTTNPRVNGDEDPREASTATQLTEMLAESGKVERCFATNWFRYANARLEVKGDAENRTPDACELENVRKTLDGGGTIRDALRKFALAAQFRQRVAQP